MFLGIIITILFWWPNAAVPFEVPKVIFFQYFVKILTLIFAFASLTKPKLWKIDKKLGLVLVIFLIWSTISSLFGVDIPKSFIGNYYRNDGLLTLYHLVGFSFLINFFWKENFKKSSSLSFFISSIILSFITMYEIIIHKFGLGTAATFGNPNFLAGYLAVSLPFSFYLFKERGIIIPALAIILIGANSAILALILFLILYLVFFANFKFKKYLILLFSFLFGLIIIFWSRNYYLENLKVFNTEGRVRIFRNVLTGFAKRPILGYGWSNVDYAFDSNVWPLKFDWHDIYVDKAHSELLEILTTTGIPGLIIYLIFIFLVFRKVSLEKDKLWKFTLLSILILYLFHSQTNVISIAEQMIFWLVVGFCLIDTD